MSSGAHLNVNGWESRVKLKSIFSISPFSTSRGRTAAVLGIRIGSALQIHFLHNFFAWFCRFCWLLCQRHQKSNAYWNRIDTLLLLNFILVFLARFLAVVEERHQKSTALHQRSNDSPTFTWSQCFAQRFFICQFLFHRSILDQLLWTLVSTSFLSNGCSFLQLSRDCMWLKISMAKGSTRKKTPSFCARL